MAYILFFTAFYNDRLRNRKGGACNLCEQRFGSSSCRAAPPHARFRGGKTVRGYSNPGLGYPSESSPGQP